MNWEDLRQLLADHEIQLAEAQASYYAGADLKDVADKLILTLTRTTASVVNMDRTEAESRYAEKLVALEQSKRL